MMTGSLPSLALLVGVACALAACVSPEPADAASGGSMVRLDFSRRGRWAFTARGPYRARLDRRALYVVEHPWQPAQAGSHGSLQATVSIPAEWRPPFVLHLYCSDDYVADGWRAQPNDWLGSEAYVGHRFKQVLADDQVVWERDVADTDAERGVRVDLTSHVTPGKPFRLALRVTDRVGTDQTLPGDYLHIGSTETAVKKVEDPRRFMTHVWWGDVTLSGGTAEAPAGARPITEAVAKSHARRWPLPPLSERWKGPITLDLEAPAGLPEGGWPLSCGVPLPPGRLRDQGRLRLLDAHGVEVPAQIGVMNNWADGSVRWVRVDALAWEGQGPYRLETARRKALAPAQPVRVTESGSACRVDTGALAFSMGEEPDALLSDVRLPGSDQPIARVQGRLQVEGDAGPVTYVPRWQEAKLVAAGPVRACVELRGQLVPEGRPAGEAIGRFVFRVEVFAGQTALRTFFRVFNDTAKTLRIRDLSLLLPAHAQGPVMAAWHAGQPQAVGTEPLRVQQVKADAFEVRQGERELEKGARAEGWLAWSDGQSRITVAVRHLAEEFPKALVATGEGVQVALFAPTPEEPFYQPAPGEAKRHEVLLDFGRGSLDAGTAARRAAAFQSPPRLFSASYFCASGGLGAAHPHTDAVYAPLHQFMAKAYGPDPMERLGVGKGIRNFGDAVYNAAEHYWRNNYYDVMMGCFGEYLMGGGRRWLDVSEAAARHIMDVDQIHLDPGHPDWSGAVHAYNSVDHTGGGFWNAMLREGGGLAACWRLTGDPDAREALLSLADFIVRENAGIGSSSVRDHAGVFITLVWALDETHDPRYAAMCRKLVVDLRNRIDPRRGSYAEIHGNYNYRGNIPWMDAQLMEPLYLYYRMTGDVEAAQLVVGLGESMMCENMTPGVPGDFYGYSHNPHFQKTSGYHILLAPSILYAYDLTGDREFLACARAAYEQTLRENTVNHPFNCYWNTPTLLHFLSATGYHPAPQAPKAK